MTRVPFSLSAYLALTRGGQRPDTSGWPVPSAPVVWLHVSSPRDARALLTVCERLAQQCGGVHVVVTGLGGRLPGDCAAPNVSACATPPESRAEIDAFVRHWRPAACIWNGSALRPALLLAARQAGCRLTLLLAQDRPFSVPRLNWLGDIPTSILRNFDAIFVTPETLHARLARMDLPATRLERAGALSDGPLPPRADDDLREELATFLAGRPVWLAARVRREEIDIVLRAHRRVGRYVHRLLLVLVPEPDCPADLCSEVARDLGLRVSSWDDEAENPATWPDENVQVVVAPDPDSLGLWYRIASVSFLGGSLLPGHGGTDPFAAVALGSAVLYGPHVGSYLDRYSELVDAGAARIVKDMESLATAVNTVIAPDKCALMAHAGWDLVTAGAQLSDALIECLQDAIDAQEPA